MPTIGNHFQRSLQDLKNLTFCTKQFVLQERKYAQTGKFGQLVNHLKDLNRMGGDDWQDAGVVVKWFGFVEKVQLLEFHAAY